ncbi:hypothetical protein ColKHC_14090 [Colletotrichum higginsianum]|nr:hypothetical protein ColKHC_14090 [Colletotrichum higginsianum]
MFMNAPPRLGYHGLDVFAFEQDMKARAQQRFNDRRQKKFFVRNGKFPLSHHGRPTQQPGVMASEDWSLASVPDGIQDSFELRNRYLAGTAGSPYADHDHGIFYQRAQRLDGSLGNKRPVVDHTHLWQPPFGVHDVNDIQSIICFFGRWYKFRELLVVLLRPADGSAIITSPSDQFDYAHSSYTNSSMVHEDLHNNIKRAPPSPPAFSEPAPLHFFATSQEQLVEGQCHMDGHEEAVRAAMLENHGGCSGIKADPATRHMLSSRPRRELPDQSRSSRTGPGSSSRRRGSPSRKQSVSAAAAHKSEPRPTQSKQSKPCPAQASPMDPTERSAKDEYLLKAKQEGLTYREIRVKGNFTEAESTLRGRYRTLTKNKEARVRKPEWTDKDVHLLQRAVRKFAKGNDPASTKIPWKQVAEYIQRNGGSYLFGNATCRKKWDELVLAALEGQM